MVETFKPFATMRGITLARSVVLPEPLQPARPMMRMRHDSNGSSMRLCGWASPSLMVRSIAAPRSPEPPQTHTRCDASRTMRPGPRRLVLRDARLRETCVAGNSVPARSSGRGGTPLLRGLHARLRRRSAARLFLLEPEPMVLFRPVHIDGAVPHAFEGAFHADGADIAVAEHQRDEQDRGDAVDDLGQLHAGNVGAVEREHEEITCDRQNASGNDLRPVDHLLAGIEAVSRGTLMADNAAAFLEPLHIDSVRHVP